MTFTRKQQQANRNPFCAASCKQHANGLVRGNSSAIAKQWQTLLSTWDHHEQKFQFWFGFNIANLSSWTRSLNLARPALYLSFQFGFSLKSQLAAHSSHSICEQLQGPLRKITLTETFCGRFQAIQWPTQSFKRGLFPQQIRLSERSIAI